MLIDFRRVEVKSTRYIRPESARELLSKQAVIDPIAVKRIAGFDPADPDGSRTVEITQMAADMAQFKSDPSALDILVKRLSEGLLEQEMKWFMDSSAMWAEAYKEIIKHPVRNWLHATWWMIRQLLRKK